MSAAAEPEPEPSSVSSRDAAFDIVESFDPLPKRVPGERSHVETKGGVRVAFTPNGRPFPITYKLDNFSKSYCHVRLKTETMQVETEAEPLNYDYVVSIPQREKTRRHSAALLFVEVFEEARSTQPEAEDVQDLAAAEDPTNGYLWLCPVDDESYGWNRMGSGRLFDGLTCGQRMSVILQIRGLVFKLWKKVS